MSFAAIARKACWHEIGSKIRAAYGQCNSMVFSESSTSKLDFTVKATPAEKLDSPKPLLKSVRTFCFSLPGSSCLNVLANAFSIFSRPSKIYFSPIARSFFVIVALTDFFSRSRIFFKPFFVFFEDLFAPFFSFNVSLFTPFSTALQSFFYPFLVMLSFVVTSKALSGCFARVFVGHGGIL